MSHISFMEENIRNTHAISLLNEIRHLIKNDGSLTSDLRSVIEKLLRIGKYKKFELDEIIMFNFSNMDEMEDIATAKIGNILINHLQNNEVDLFEKLLQGDKMTEKEKTDLIDYLETMISIIDEENNVSDNILQNEYAL